MKELVAVLEGVGARDVGTYIQSGNAVFRSEEEDVSVLSKRIRAGIGESRGFEPHVLLLEPEEVERALRSNPFPEAEPRTLHAFFMASSPEGPDLEGLERVKGAGERFALRENVLYLHAPDGIGRSRLAANAEKRLGVPTTARNWRTLREVVAMARRIG